MRHTILFGLSACLLVVSSCISAKPRVGAPPSTASTTRPDDTSGDSAGPKTHLGNVVDRDGRQHDLDAILQSGRRLVFVFWQSWCKPCRREAPGLQAAARAHRGELAFFGVVTGNDEHIDDGAVAKFIQSYGIDYPQIRDRDATWWHRYQIKGTPTIVVVGRGGKVLFQGHRPPDWAELTSRAVPSKLDTVASTAKPTAPKARAHRADLPRLVKRWKKTGVMGTPLEITAIGTDGALLERAIDAAIAELRRVEDEMTSWRESPLNDVNAASGSGAIPAPEELCRLTARALDIGELTDGAFDITFASVGKLWDFKAPTPHLPEREQLAAALRHVDYRKVDVDLEQSTITLPKGSRIGLGGIAKGYGVDRAMKVLLQHGVRNAIVNAGGDMKVLGTNFGQPWQVAIKHPRDRERALAVLDVENTCVVTSGDYERFFEIDGKRYHHIIDPRTGMPASGAISASVVAQDAAFADALATALCVLGPSRGLPIIESLPRVEAVIVGIDGEVQTSSGLAGLFRSPQQAQR